MPSDAPSRKIDQLIRVLTQSTKGQTVGWSTTVDEEQFRFASHTANVQIEKSERFDPVAEALMPRRVLQVFNRQGRLIEEYSPEDPYQVRQFDTLYDLARRSAYKTDDVLDVLLQEIPGSTDFE